MTKAKRFVFCDDITVTKSKNDNFYVDFGCNEYEIFVSQKDVLKIKKASKDERDEIIAILLATIKLRLKMTRGTGVFVRGLSDETIDETIEELLFSGQNAEDLIQILGQMKWHDICEIMKSNNPKEVLERIKEEY